MIDTTALSKALRQLEVVLALLKSGSGRSDPEIQQVYRTAAVKCFEYTFETAASVTRRALEETAAGAAGLRNVPFLDMMRMAGDAGLVRDPLSFRAWRDKRNATSHAYDEARAEDVVTGLDAFIDDVRFLLAELERRNHA